MHEQKNFKIIHEDDEVIVIDKPSGILVTPDFKNQTPTLTDFLNKYLISGGRQYRAYPCHRIDRETSGLVIFAKGEMNQKLLMQEFKLRKVKKRYIAFVQGALNSAKGTIKSYISSSFKHNNKDFRKSPKLAITDYRVIAFARDFSVVEIRPITGRTNQIRIHFKQLRHPLLGERKYAFGKDFALKFRRLALHASNLVFLNPVTHKRIEVSSDLPNDMQSFIDSKIGKIDLR